MRQEVLPVSKPPSTEHRQQGDTRGETDVRCETSSIHVHCTAKGVLSHREKDKDREIERERERDGHRKRERESQE